MPWRACRPRPMNSWRGICWSPASKAVTPQQHLSPRQFEAQEAPSLLLCGREAKALFDCSIVGSLLEIHTAHTAHPATARHGRRARLFRPLGDHRLGRDEEGRHRGCSLKGKADDLGRVDDPGLYHVDVSTVLRVKAMVGIAL